MAKRISLKNKVVAITGGAQGIGLATATQLKQLGAKVSIGDIDVEKAQAVADQQGFYASQLDVRDRNSFAEFIRSTETQLGNIDILINNAGIMPMSAFTDEEDAVTDAQIDINLRGVITGMKLVLPSMQQRNSGHIVNLASLAGAVAIPGASVYSATKFAVMGLSDGVRQELRDTNIHVSTILPSKVLTDLSSGTEGAMIPAVQPEEVAQAVVDAVQQKIDSLTVPRYLSPVARFYNTLPTRLTRLLRESLNDTHILKQLNNSSRKGYADKLLRMAQGK